MNYLSKKHTFWTLLIALLCLHSSCKKEQIAPPNQELAYIKYFGHVGDQKASDLIRTIDGGYIMVGGTNSFGTQAESNVYVVKTDASGNEVWSTSLGKMGGQLSSGKYMRYDETGIRIIELLDGSGYVVAANRAYYEYATPSSTDRLHLKTKVVLYQLDLAGLPLVLGGVELREATSFTEEVSDMKMDTSGGLLRYVLTGYTTDVKVTKNNHGPADTKDIFTVLVDENFNILWDLLGLAYGFDREDFGASVHVLDDTYLVTGTTQVNDGSGPHAQKIIAVRMKKINGVPLNPRYLGDINYTCAGGYSVYDPVNRLTTVTGSIIDGVNPHIGHAFFVQLDEYLNVKTNGAPFGFEFYRPKAPTMFPMTTTNRFSPKSIVMLPNNEGYLVSMTHQKNPTEYNVAVMKVSPIFDKEPDWTYFFGYEDLEGGTKITDQEAAGTVMAVINEVEGTNQRELKGYIVTGTFHVGTNNMIGLIKMNLNGEIKPSN